MQLSALGAEMLMSQGSGAGEEWLPLQNRGIAYSKVPEIPMKIEENKCRRRQFTSIKTGLVFWGRDQARR